jgi:hypothetical protein
VLSSTFESLKEAMRMNRIKLIRHCTKTGLLAKICGVCIVACRSHDSFPGGLKIEKKGRERRVHGLRIQRPYLGSAAELRASEDMRKGAALT